MLMSLLSTSITFIIYIYLSIYIYIYTYEYCVSSRQYLALSFYLIRTENCMETWKLFNNSSFSLYTSVCGGDHHAIVCVLYSVLMNLFMWYV